MSEEIEIEPGGSAPTKEAAQKMHIHKPKPFHGLREFLKEYGIIVLGVLTALGLEQVGEVLHWRHEVGAEREALSSELGGNLTAVTYRVHQEACIDRRLDELDRIFTRQAHGQPLRIKGPVGRPPLWLWTRGAWEIALSDQALAHMPLQDRLTMSEAFDDYRSFSDIREQEDAVWRRLSLLDHPDVLTPADWPLLREAYGEALGFRDRLQLKMVYMIKHYRFGQEPKPPELTAELTKAERSFCSPITD